MNKKPVSRQFNQGDTPTIAVFNQATVSLGVDFNKLITAMQSYVDKYVAPRWACPANLVKSDDFVKGAWAVAFLDDADVQGALAYHDVTPDGLPLSKVFVKTTIKNKESVPVAGSHELAEMLIDPGIQMMTTGPNLRLTYALEGSDPVEALSFPVNGIPMSDFVFPSYFEVFRKAGSVQFDQMGKVRKPFQILPGGYQIVFNGRQWMQVFGSTAKAKKFAKEDRRGHRSEQRKKQTEMAAKYDPAVA
jgi:hypothetical protein